MVARGTSSKGEGFSVELDPKQFNELRGLMEDLPRNVRKNAMNAATRKGAQRILERAQTILRESGAVDSGRLISSLKVRKRDGKYGDSFFKRTIGVSLGKKRGDLSGAYYALFVEYGHRVVTPGGRYAGKNVPAVHFLRGALEETYRRNVHEFSVMIQREFESRARKLSKA